MLKEEGMGFEPTQLSQLDAVPERFDTITTTLQCVVIEDAV